MEVKSWTFYTFHHQATNEQTWSNRRKLWSGNDLLTHHWLHGGEKYKNSTSEQTQHHWLMRSSKLHNDFIHAVLRFYAGQLLKLIFTILRNHSKNKLQNAPIQLQKKDIVQLSLVIEDQHSTVWICPQPINEWSQKTRDAIYFFIVYLLSADATNGLKQTVNCLDSWGYLYSPKLLHQ